jgi:hypothetical protein
MVGERRGDGDAGAEGQVVHREDDVGAHGQ